MNPLLEKLLGQSALDAAYKPNAAKPQRSNIDVTGLKRMYVGVPQSSALTPYGRKRLARRRAANKVARRARALNARRS